MNGVGDLGWIANSLLTSLNDKSTLANAKKLQQRLSLDTGDTQACYGYFMGRGKDLLYNAAI